VTRFSVVHETRYRYDSEIHLAYNRAHLLPRQTPHQAVTAAALLIDPEPDVRWDSEDADGNQVVFFSLERPHHYLTVTATSEVRLAPRPMPLAAALAWEDAVSAVRATVGRDRTLTLDTPLVRRSPALFGYATPSFPPGRRLHDAVADLSERIFSEFTYLPGTTTVSTPAEDVLAHRRGVCQDFAHLMVGCLRSLGLAARYVSGYLESGAVDGGAELIGAAASHAWVAVRLGDGTWLDLDPTNNLVDPQHHITVAWGRDYGDVVPLGGVLFGSGGGSTLQVGVDVRRY
jgi:transglutaminase-like putative cysteine protease